jgi:hypothetical protein
MGLELRRHVRLQVGGERGAEVAAIDTPAREHPEVRHEVVAAVALAHQHLRLAAVAADDDQGGGVAGAYGAGARFTQAAAFGPPGCFDIAHETTV